MAKSEGQLNYLRLVNLFLIMWRKQLPVHFEVYHPHLAVLPSLSAH